MAQTLTGKYPVQYDHFDMWLPEGSASDMKSLLELATAFLYTHNGCVECEVPKDHPAPGTERVFVVNPLAPNNGTFWETTLRPVVKHGTSDLAKAAVLATDNLYKVWKKWISDHSSYRAKSKLPLYNHPRNRVPLDGWGIVQIEHELKELPDEIELTKANEKRREALKKLKEEIISLLNKKMTYWDQG